MKGHRGPRTTSVPIFDQLPDWHTDAACRGLDPNIFFPGTGYVGGPLAHELAAKRRAIATCKTCPVREPCLEEGLKPPNAFGIWGGLMPEKRKRIRRRRAA